MFHLLILLMGLFFFAIAVVVGAILLFGIALAVASIFGGVSAAVLIKDKTISRLMMIGCLIVLLVAALCLSPFVVALSDISLDLYATSISLLAVIIILTIIGIKTSKNIDNKIGRTASTVLFYIACAIAVIFIIFIIVLMLIMKSSA